MTSSDYENCSGYIMAHKNIEVRRNRVRDLLSEGPLTMTMRHAVAREFGCSPSAIYMDEISMRPTLVPGSIHVSQALRDKILNRDEWTCQYCEKVCDTNITVEYVVPFALGGVAQPYNLVAACQSCNTRKRSQVWVPYNLDDITADHPEWRARVMRLV